MWVDFAKALLNVSLCLGTCFKHAMPLYSDGDQDCETQEYLGETRWQKTTSW
jgi:hypothetical protein